MKIKFYIARKLGAGHWIGCEAKKHLRHLAEVENKEILTITIDTKNKKEMTGKIGWVLQLKAEKKDKKWHTNFDSARPTKTESIESFNKNREDGEAYPMNKRLGLMRCVPIGVILLDNVK